MDLKFFKKVVNAKGLIGGRRKKWLKRALSGPL